MLISGDIQRSIYPQEHTFSFAMQVSVNTALAPFEFGFKAGSAKVPITFTNGRILDHSGRFIGSYAPDTDVEISGAISPTTVDLFIAGQPRVLGSPRHTGVLDTFYVNTPGSGESVADLDLFVFGETPEYSVSDNIVFNTGEAVILDAYFINHSDQPLRIFTGNYLGLDSTFLLSGLPAGNVNNSGLFHIIAKGSDAGGARSLPFTFETNFGPVSFSVNTSGIIIVPPTYFIDMFAGVEVNNTTSPMMVSCSFGDTAGELSVRPMLQYVSGSGQNVSAIPATGQYVGNITGLISGSGYLTAHVTVPASGIGGVFETLFSGNMDAIVSGWFVATGSTTINWSIPAYGLVSGYNVSGLITGSFTTGISGSANLNLQFTGVPTLEFTSQPTGYVQSVNYLNLGGAVTGDLFYIFDSGQAIGFGYDFNDAGTLISYLAANTGRHHAIGQFSGSNVRILPVEQGAAGNGYACFTDICNEGTAFFVNPTTTGGQTLGSGLAVIPSVLTGQFNQTVVATGIFSQPFSGDVSGFISGLNYEKTFTGLWDLYTGDQPGQGLMIDYQFEGLYNDAHSLYSGDAITSSYKTFYICVSYNNQVDSNIDYVNLIITGVNQPTGLIFPLSGYAS